ncbi:hypothetical protein IPC1218_11160 [Pseudomonas aeruginosa]|nr:hypothetical protein [Pseudomonas aeruginosa]RUE78137.1 hypothetical protein IPC1218_11160 [Pseudomonas aeruginosa]HBP1806229.1 hypothetical protein [Pseudomonas aeruginosa]HBP5297012.1 hypothetical protein [Pseudomonas aeruginosa]HBP5518983.1 hypothetical protein [Pseudomonas aeruginosa]
MAFGSTRRWVMEVKAKTKRDSGLRTAVLLLKRANRYVGVHNSIGAMDLSTEIVEFIAAIERQEKGL